MFTGRTLSRTLRRFSTRVEPDIDGIAYGYMGSQALYAGLHVGVFDALAQGPLAVAALREKTGVHAPRLQTLLTTLTAHNLLYSTGGPTATYELPENVAKFLVTDSKLYYGDYIKDQIGGLFYTQLGELSHVMVTGEAKDYSSWFSDPAVAQKYTKAQHNGSLATARALFKRIASLSSASSLLDVGGGSGAFAIVGCRKNAGLHADVLELPEVAATGRGLADQEEASVSKRITFIPGSCMEKWQITKQYDAVLMSYVSGSVPAASVDGMYKQALAALRPGGQLLVHDFMTDDHLQGPALAAGWQLQHVTINADGAGLTPSWVRERMLGAGFTNVEDSDLITGMTKLVHGTKPGA